MLNMNTIMKALEAKNTFERNHPKAIAFFRAVTKTPLEEGTIVEITVKKPEQEPLSCNIKLNSEDIELLRQLKELRG